MRLLIDMNLAPRWVEFFQTHGVESSHWSAIGDHRAKDDAIMAFARDEGYVVFTHDLDFSYLLAITQASGPSILQVRTQNVTPEAIGSHVLGVLKTYKDEFERGAIVTIDESSSRVRILPIASA